MVTLFFQLSTFLSIFPEYITLIQWSKHFYFVEEFLPFICLVTINSWRFNVRNASHITPCYLLIPPTQILLCRCVLPQRVCLPHLVAHLWGQKMVQYLALCPGSSINITSFLQKQCHGYDFKLQVWRHQNCQSITSGRRIYPIKFFFNARNKCMAQGEF